MYRDAVIMFHSLFSIATRRQPLALCGNLLPVLRLSSTLLAIVQSAKPSPSLPVSNSYILSASSFPPPFNCISLQHNVITSPLSFFSFFPTLHTPSCISFHSIPRPISLCHIHSVQLCLIETLLNSIIHRTIHPSVSLIILLRATIHVPEPLFQTYLFSQRPRHSPWKTVVYSSPFPYFSFFFPHLPSLSVSTTSLSNIPLFYHSSLHVQFVPIPPLPLHSFPTQLSSPSSPHFQSHSLIHSLSCDSHTNTHIPLHLIGETPNRTPQNH